MLTYTLLNKAEKDRYLPLLFDLYHTNMHHIAPSGLSYEAERKEWLCAVSPALDKAPRQILLCRLDHELAGFVQYYTRQDLLMIEELQISPNFQHSTVFLSLVRALVRLLPDGISHVEAYAHKRNYRSIMLMQRLGMEEIPEPQDSMFVHLRGCSDRIKAAFLKR